MPIYTVPLECAKKSPPPPPLGRSLLPRYDSIGRRLDTAAAVREGNIITIPIAGKAVGGAHGDPMPDRPPPGAPVKPLGLDTALPSRFSDPLWRKSVDRGKPAGRLSTQVYNCAS